MSLPGADSNPTEHEECLGEAIEAYLTLAEAGEAPDPEEFAARYPDLEMELREAFEGLALVRGLVGDSRGESGSLRAGRRVAGYRIVRELGRGGMGIVYEAVHVDLDRPVALKVLGYAAAPDSNSRRRFLNEAKTAAGLHHTYIVPVFDVGQVGSLCYYAMQRIEGSGLDRVIKLLKQTRSGPSGADPSDSRPTPRATPGAPLTEPLTQGPDQSRAAMDRRSLTDATASWVQSSSRTSRLGIRIPPDDDLTTPYTPPTGSSYYRWVAQAGKQAAEGLAYAHRRGVIHRDIKPSNLLVDERGNTWIADFGLASRATDPGQSHTHATGPVGTPRYMSPEQAAAQPVDPRTDVYSLGATLYEMLTLRPAFDGATSAEVIEQIRTKDPLPPRKITPRTPRDLETIILKAMSKRPVDRYESSEALAEDLTRYLASEPVRARRIGPVGRLIRFARRHPFSSSISATAAAIVLTVATWAYLRVLNERNTAVAAQEQTATAMKQVRAAIQHSEAARAQQLWRESTVIRLSALPERRNQGLNRLTESASLTADLDLQARLREEAVAFLALRDVEPRTAVETGPTWGTVFTPAANPPTLASLAENAESIALHGLADGELSQRIDLPWFPSGAPGRPNAPSRPPGRGGGQRLGTGIAVSGSFLATIWPNGQGVRRIEPRTGTIHDEIALPDRQIEAIQATPDGRRLITLERQARPGPTGPGRAPGPGGRPFLSLRAVLWDFSNPSQPLATLAEPPTSESTVQPARFPDIPLLAIGPDSQTIAQSWLQFQAPEAGSTVTLFDAETGLKSSAIEGIPGNITALTLGPNQLLAAALGDGSIRIWEGSTHASLPGLYHHQSTVRTLTFSPDGSLLALAGGSTGIEVWDVATNTLVAALQAPAAVLDLKFSPDGTTLAATTNTVTARWQIIEPVGRSTLSGFDNRINSVAFGPEGALSVGDWNGQTRLWSPSKGPSMGRTLTGPRGPGFLVYDKQGKLLSIGMEGLDLRPFELLANNNFLRFSDAVPAASSRDLELPSPPNIASMLQTPTLVGGSAIIVQGTMLEAFRRTQMRRPPSWITYSQGDSGNRLAISQGGEVVLWNSNQPNRLQRVQIPEFERVRPGGSRRGRERGEGPGPRGPVGWQALALDPQGSALYLLDFEGTLHAWSLTETASGLVVATRQAWSATSGNYTSLALSRDGHWLACGMADGTVKVLSPTTGIARFSIKGTEGEARGRITALAFAPNSNTLAVGDQRGTLDLWSLPLAPNLSGQEQPTRLLKFPPHVGSVGPIAFDREGRYLASAGDDKIVQIWELDQIEHHLENLRLGWTTPISQRLWPKP